MRASVLATSIIRGRSILPSYGLIVEGAKDAAVYPCLTRRTDSPDADTYVLDCGGVGRLMKEFPAFLRRFEHVHNGGPVDKAIVIRDADRKRADDVIAEMRRRLGDKTYGFPVDLCVISRETETLLLADIPAIQRVSGARGGGRVPPVQENLDTIFDAKGRLSRVLSEARLSVTPALYAEIAKELDLGTLRQRVPTFNDFERSVLAGMTPS